MAIAQTSHDVDQLYDSYMKEIAVSAARDRMAEIIEKARDSGKPISLTRRGRVVAVLLSPDVFDQLSRDAEDTIDRAAAVLAREDDDFIPWEQVKEELGLS